MYNYNTSGLGVLSRLPPEIIQSILFVLVAQRPLGTPSALVPLFTTSKDVHAIATSPALLARVFRFKFDAGAVARRHFRPTHADLKEQLVHACTLLRKLRSGNVFDRDAHATLFSALVLLFENDGKNYAQLEWAGVKEFAEEFMKRRMWEDARDTNEGWPLDNTANSSALWILWLTLTKERLQTESHREREEFILFILPYILLTFRYAASQAPPNHFDLPLGDHDPISFPIPSASPNPPRYPIYPDELHSTSQPHFRARIHLRPPLASIAAKLLYVSRREVRKISPPPHLPLVPGPITIGPTQADFLELNKGKAAALPRGARWDWTSGCAWGVNFPDEGDETAAERAAPPELRIAVGDEESCRWDTVWWRMRLCKHSREAKPKFAPGDVYRPGSMSGQWKGRIYVPAAETFHHLLYTPQYPGATDERGLFSEAGVLVVMQPFHLELEEHHRICGCAASTATTSPCGVIPTPPPILQEFTLHPAPLPTPDLEAEAAQAAADVAAAQAETAAEHAGEAVRSDDTPAGNTHWNDPHAGNLARGRRARDGGEPGDDESAPRDDEDVEEDDQEEEEEEARNPHAQEIPRGLQTVRFPVDHGMRNAWFPGRVGGITFAKRKVLQGLAEREEMMRGSWDRSAPSNVGHEHDGSGDENQDENLNLNPKIHRRDEAVFSISGITPDVKLDGKCSSLASDAVGGFRHSSSSSLGSSSTPTPCSSTSPTYVISSSSGAAQPQSQPQSWVYETYDPTRVSAHDLHLHQGPSSSSSSLPSLHYSIATPNPSCAHCVALAEARRLEKTKADDKTRKALLDRMMRAIPADGSGSGSSSMAPMDVDSCDDGDGDVEMEDLDMSGFGFVGDDDRDDDDEEEEEEEEEEGDEEDGISVLGDDLPNGQPGFWTSSDRLASPSPERVSRASTSSNLTTPTHKHRDTSSKRTYVSSTRREFDRARITTSSPCAGIQDIVLSGHTPQQHALWYTGGRGYTFYGRVRPWDGLIGIMRVGAASASAAAAGGGGGNGGNAGEEGAEGGLLLDTTFIFGYLVGDTTFVGEWRVAGADPLRPAYGGPIVLSRR